jgi:hypothetical protein
MIKTSWTPADQPVQGFPMDPDSFGKDLDQGTWLKDETRQPSTDDDIFTVADETGKLWRLVAMHIAAKQLRTWVWISLWWDWDAADAFGADHPHFLLEAWPSLWKYHMCIASGFVEGDSDPASFYRHVSEKFQRRILGDEYYEDAIPEFDTPTPFPDLTEDLAEVLEVAQKAMEPAQWCANPFLEVDMAAGNCIGCHQGAPLDFRSSVFLQQRQYNVSDFSFSFATLADTIRKVDQEGTPKRRQASPLPTPGH